MTYTQTATIQKQRQQLLQQVMLTFANDSTDLLTNWENSNISLKQYEASLYFISSFVTSITKLVVTVLKRHKQDKELKSYFGVLFPVKTIDRIENVKGYLSRNMYIVKAVHEALEKDERKNKNSNAGVEAP